ncbi:MAG: N-acetylmuramoyl-L-alanine amidase, partial [Acidobacteria bacterium]|nr:N-acetylmuramoyl-L-alanine amidase [Acidobacteriota bacterium]
MPWNRHGLASRIPQFLGFALFIGSAVMLGAPEAGAQGPVIVPAPTLATLVMIDPAHGGIESGAVLNPAIPEKDVNLAFA